MRARRAGTAALALAAAVAVGAGARGDVSPPPPLFSAGVVAGPDGVPMAVPPGAERGPVGASGTRADRYADLRADALRDLDLMVLDGGERDGAVLAGMHPAWKYTWTRDAAWVAAALAVSGRLEDARRVLGAVQRDELRRVAAGQPGWQARYRPDGSGVPPDDRGRQLDGPGWVLWATSVFVDAGEASQQQATLEGLRPLVTLAARTAVECLDPGSGLPPVSQDYWEVRTTRRTLGIAAPLLAGLRSAGPLLEKLGLDKDARATRAAAARLDQAVERTFGARGYPRHITGGAKDTSVAWLTPPFGPARPASLSARDKAYAEAARAIGGVAPGADWEDNGVAWTPETAIFALSFAASGQRARAESVIDWLEAHRTAMGSLPEKVDGAGQPASVAPLSWTAAAVLLTLAELDGSGVPHL